MCCGIRAHSFLRDCRGSCCVLFPCRRAWTALTRTSQTYSIQDKSGDMADQSILFTSLQQRKSSTIRARWDLALSSWNIGSATGIWQRNGSTWGVRTSSMHRWPFKFPSMNTRSVLAVADQDAAFLIGYPRYHCSWNMPARLVFCRPLTVDKTWTRRKTLLFSTEGCSILYGSGGKRDEQLYGAE